MIEIGEGSLKGLPRREEQHVRGRHVEEKRMRQILNAAALRRTLSMVLKPGCASCGRQGERGGGSWLLLRCARTVCHRGRRGCRQS